VTDVECAIHRRIDNNGATVLLCLQGSFDRAGAPELRRALHDAFVRRRAARIILDVAEVDSIGSDSLELLLVGYTRALRVGLGYEVVNAGGPVRLALEAVGLCERSPDVHPVSVPAPQLAPFDLASLVATAELGRRPRTYR
jgi:anti-anti-sigma factor